MLLVCIISDGMHNKAWTLDVKTDLPPFFADFPRKHAHLNVSV